MAQNKIIKGRNNAVVITFSGVDLTDFTTKIEATYGDDTRNDVDDPLDVVVDSATQLSLFYGDTTETENQYWQIIGFSPTFPLGLELTSECLGNLGRSTVCE